MAVRDGAMRFERSLMLILLKQKINYPTYDVDVARDFIILSLMRELLDLTWVYRYGGSEQSRSKFFTSILRTYQQSKS